MVRARERGCVEVSDLNDEQPDTRAGAAADETEVVAKDVATQLGGLAWSDDDADVRDNETERHPWSMVTGQAAVLVSVGAAVATVTAVLGWMWIDGRRNPHLPAAVTTVAPSAVQAAPSTVQAPQTSAEMAPTQIVTAVAVAASGQPAKGYLEIPAGSISELGGCDESSANAVSPNIYSCYPTAAGADICWPSPPASMLCMTNPWDKEVSRLSYDTSLLVAVQPPATPEPIALTLDNGAHCRFITGGARRGRKDGYVPFYVCGADSTAYVLGDAGSRADPVNRSKPLWTVTFEQPGFETQVRSVSTVWFAGN
jgi:hypothetical protein